MDLEMGDVLFIQGHRFRHRLNRYLLGRYFNHICIYTGNGEVIELAWHGTPEKDIVEKYRGKSVVVIRPKNLDDLRTKALITTLNVLPPELYGLRFDWLGFTCQLLHLPRIKRKNKVRCDEFAQEIYRCAYMDIDFWKLMGGGLTFWWIPSTVSGVGFQRVFDWRQDGKFLE